MNTSSRFFFVAALTATSLPALGQLPNPPSRQPATSMSDSGTVPDGITFYRGQTFLLRNGRAALVDGTVVPPDMALTRTGGLVPVPPELLGTMPPRDRITPSLSADAMQNALVHWRGETYVIRAGTVTKVDASLVPEGQVLTSRGSLAALPADFSGFVQDRGVGAPTGVAEMDSGPQAPRITTSQPAVAGPGTSGVTRTGVITNPNGSTTAIGVTPNGAAVTLNEGTVLTSDAVNGTATGNVPSGNMGAQTGSRYYQPGTTSRSRAASSGGPASVNSNGVDTVVVSPDAIGGSAGGAAGATGNGGMVNTTQGAVRVNGATSSTMNQGGQGGAMNGTANGMNNTAQPGAAAGAGQSTTTGQAGTVSSQNTPVALQNGTVSTQATPPATPNGTVNTQGTPPATANGTVNTQSTPAATQTGTVNTQGTPAASQTGASANPTGTNPNSFPGNTGTSGTNNSGTATGTSTSTTGTSGTTGGGTTGGGTSGGTSTGGGSSGGTSGGGTSGGSSGGGTSGGSSGGGTSGGSSGGGTSGGGSAGGGAGGGS